MGRVGRTYNRRPVHPCDAIGAKPEAMGLRLLQKHCESDIDTDAKAKEDALVVTSVRCCTRQPPLSQLTSKIINGSKCGLHATLIGAQATSFQLSLYFAIFLPVNPSSVSTR